MKTTVVLLLASLATLSLAAVKTQEPELNRQIHGSNGPYREFRPSDCNQPLETTPHCTNWEYAYHWNNAYKECERAIYHGCNPTRNNFRTLRDCKSQAEPICNTGGRRPPHHG